MELPGSGLNRAGFKVSGGTDSRTQVGVIDIGSNSIRLVVYDIYGAHFIPVYNEKILAGLGRDLKATGRLSEKGKQACLQAMQRFDRIARARNLPKLLIGATAAMRAAKDAPVFIQEIFDRTGLKIDPISGPEEARLSAMGLIAADARRAGLAADLGGASLELMQVAKGQVGQSVSMPLGPFDVVGSDLRKITSEAYMQIGERIDALLRPLSPDLTSSDTLYLIGGAWRNLAALHQQRTSYPMRTMQAYEIGSDAARDLGRWAYTDGLEMVLDWSGMRRKRAETLPYAGLMLEKLLALTKAKKIIISTGGLREGMVFDTFSPTVQARDAMLDGCYDFAHGRTQEKDFGAPLFEFIKDVAASVPVVFNAVSDRRMYQAACLLAGIGKNLHPDYRAELVFDNILYAPIAGLTHQERAFLALILFRSFTHKRAIPNAPAVEKILTEGQIETARVIGAVIRLAIVATGRSVELLGEFKVYIEGDVLTLSVSPEEVALITDQVMFRLKRLGQFMGLTAHVDTHKG